MTETMMVAMKGRDSESLGRKGAQSKLINKNEWHDLSQQDAYRCQIGINVVGCEFQATAIRISSLKATGNSVSEAIDALLDLFISEIESNKEQGKPIPWSSEADRSGFQITKCLIVEIGPRITDEIIKDSMKEIEDGKTVDWEEVKGQLGL